MIVSPNSIPYPILLLLFLLKQRTYIRKNIYQDKINEPQQIKKQFEFWRWLRGPMQQNSKFERLGLNI